MDISTLPKVNFASASYDDLLENLKSLTEEQLGRTLERADPVMLLLKSNLLAIMQLRELIDYAAKQNLLAYSSGNFLEHLGALVGVSRLPATAAVTTVELQLSAARNVNTIIKAGTRITAGDGVNFLLDNNVIFAPGETSKTEKASCAQVGTVGNGYAVGELHIIVDPQPYLASIINISVSEGGADIESDDKLRARIQEVPESFSNAGSIGAYKYFTQQVSSNISDVLVRSEFPGQVAVYVLMEGGELPGTEMLDKIQAALNDEKVRPLTDLVEVKLPEEVFFDLSMTYYIARSQATNAPTIMSNVEKAAQNFITWQAAALGRDIIPDELVKLARNAGAKRLEIASPAFQVIPENAVARCNNFSISFGGIEND